MPAIRATSSASATAGDGGEPASASILRGLREMILDGVLEPGQRVRQEMVAKHFGVSRIPVREALRQLEDEGLVTLVPHSGARVALLDFDECLEVYRLREVLEPALLAQAVAHADEGDVARFRARMEGIGRRIDDLPRWLREDRLFHLETYRIAEMPRGLAIAEGLWNQTQQYRRLFIASLDDAAAEIVHLDHLMIVDAIERRDAFEAAERLAVHIRRTRSTLEESPELFGAPPRGSGESGEEAR